MDWSDRLFLLRSCLLNGFHEDLFDAEIKKNKNKNCYFPLFLSADNLQKDKDHMKLMRMWCAFSVEGFISGLLEACFFVFWRLCFSRGVSVHLCVLIGFLLREVFVLVNCYDL